MATPLSKMVQPHRPMVRFTANAVRGNPALSPSPASSARSIEQQPKVLSMPVSASPSVPNSIGRHSSYHLGDGSNNGGGPAPLSRSTSDSILDAGIHAVSSGGGGSSSSSRGLSTPSLRRTLMYLSRSSSAPLDEVSTPRHARVHGRKPFAHYGLDQRRRFGPVAFSRSASDSARRLPQPPPPPPRGNIISMGSIPALARSLSGHTDHAGHASPLPLPLSLDTPPLERGLSYMSFVTIASEGSPTNHALDSPPQPQPRFQSPVRPWIKKSRSGSTSVSRESPLTLQSYPSLQSLPSFSNIPIGLNNKPTYDSLRSVGSSGYSAEQEETDDVMYGSMRTIIQGRPQGQAQPPARRWPQPQSVLDQDHIGANAELTVVTSPPPRPSTPLPRSLSATSGGAAENCELPVKWVSVDWYSAQGDNSRRVRGLDDNTTLYSITCHTVVKGITFKVEKRYAEFVKFKDVLIDEGLMTTITPFPPRKPMRSLFGGLSNAAKDERAKGLATWLNSVISQPAESYAGNLGACTMHEVMMESRAAVHVFLSQAGVEGAYERHSETASTSNSIPTPNSFVGFGFGAEAQSGWARQDAPRLPPILDGRPQAQSPHMRTPLRAHSQPQSQWTVLDELEAGHISNRWTW
mmetsp:Transcript_6598/g.13488  ORF Transcript_6598/g.13488 Transcript_6598/m.13488 type:complete len:634 (-) Transcript_6598:238-2139(-)